MATTTAAWTDQYDPTTFKTERDKLGVKQSHWSKAVDGGKTLSAKTVGEIEAGRPVGPESLERYAELLGQPLAFFQRSPTLPRSTVLALVDVCKQAVYAGYFGAWRAIVRPWEIQASTTSGVTITDRPLSLDPTLPVDYAASKAMRKVLKRFANMPAHPLAAGAVLVDEEQGAQLISEESSAIRFIIQIDPSDDTTALQILRGGSVLISVYAVGVGW